MDFVEWMLKDVKAIWNNRYALIVIGILLLLFILVAPYIPNNNQVTCELNSTVCRTGYGMR